MTTPDLTTSCLTKSQFGQLNLKGHISGSVCCTVFRAKKAPKPLGQTLAWTDQIPLEHQLEAIWANIEMGCDHGYWRRVRNNKNSPGRCTLGKYVGQRFIFSCEHCPLTAFWACYTNEPWEFMHIEPEAEANS